MNGFDLQAQFIQGLFCSYVIFCAHVTAECLRKQVIVINSAG